MNELLPIKLVRRAALPLGPARGLRPRSLHLVLVQGPGGHPGPALGALRARQGAAGLSAPGCALVTGAARGIGRAIAVRLAADGWAVAACDRDASVSAPDGGVALTFDVTDADAVAAAFQCGRVLARAGGGRGRERRDRGQHRTRGAAVARGVAARAGREPDRRLPHRAAGASPGCASGARAGIVAISSVAATGGLRGQVVLLGREGGAARDGAHAGARSWRRSR